MRWHQINESAPLRANPAFQAWFGDSKIVDAQGEPLRLYRGIYGPYVQTADRMEARKGYAAFFTNSPHVASTYANPDTGVFMNSPDNMGAVFPVYIKGDVLKEFPVRVDRQGYRSLNFFDFDDAAKRLPSGHVLVARKVYDTGPRASTTLDPEHLYSYASDIYAIGRGTSVKSAVSNSGTFSQDDPRMTESLTEAFLTLPHGQRVNVVKNPAAQTLVAMLKRSRSAHLRGLTMDRDCYWWDAHHAIHSDIAHVLGHDEYVDDRQEIRLRSGEPCLEVDYTSFHTVKNNPAMMRLLQSPDLHCYAGSEGWLPGPEFLAAMQQGVEA